MKKVSPLTETVQTLLADFRSGLEAIYRDRLRGLYLYGSYARGNPQWDSDLDVLVILDRLDSYGAEIDRTSELVSVASLRYGISISRVFTTQQAWFDVQDGFLSQVRQEAIAA